MGGSFASAVVLGLDLGLERDHHPIVLVVHVVALHIVGVVTANGDRCIKLPSLWGDCPWAHIKRDLFAVRAPSNGENGGR